MARGQAALPRRLLWTFGLWAQSWGRQQGEAAWRCRTGIERSLLVQEVRAFSAVGNPRLGLGSRKSRGMLALLGSLKTPHSPAPYSYSICSWQETHLDDMQAQPTLFLWHLFLLCTMTCTGIPHKSSQPANYNFQGAWLFNISDGWHIWGILF